MVRKIIGLGLHNRLLALLLMGMIFIGGLLTWQRLPVDAFPDVSPNLVQVFTVTEGLAPEEVETYVTYPIEASLTGLPGVEKVRSVSNFGLSVVNVYFEDGMDIYFCRQLVNERLQEAREQIPEGFGEPGMGPISTGMGLVLFYYLKDSTGKYSLEELRAVQDWIVKFNLQTVPGVTEVLGIGGYEKQFHVIVDPNSLIRYDVTLGQVIERIKSNNLNVGGQFIEKNSEELVVRSLGLATGIQDLNDIVIKTVDGRPIYLQDLANIEVGGSIRRGLQTHNGEEEVVSGMVVKLYGSNSSSVIESVEKKIGEINHILPKGISIVPYYQQKDIVEASVSTVFDALMQGIFLVVLVLLFFLGGFRPSFVVALAIPFSVLLAIIGMGIFGLSANLMSLGGLAVAIGMLVDATIVMIENVDRLLRESDSEEPILHLISRACQEVVRPITFSIVIIIVVFLPLMTLQGVEGKTFRPLAYTVSLALFGSLIFAVLLAPTLSSFFMRRSSSSSQEPFIVRTLLRWYRPLVTFFVHQRKVAIVFAGFLLTIGLVLFPFLGSEFTPKLKEGTIVVRLTMSPSISLVESKRITMLVEKRLLKIPEVVETVTRIGRGEVGAHADPINSAEMYVILKAKNEWRKEGNQEFIENIIRTELGNIPGVQVNLTQPIEMTVDELLEGVKAELAIKLFGDDLDLLKEKADNISAVINNVRGVEDLQVDQISGTPQLQILPDRQKISRYGINIADVQSIIQSAVGGVTAGQVFEGIRRYDIFVRYPPEARDTISAIKNILIDAPNGSRVPLNELAEIKEVVGPRQITRENNQRFISVQCNVVGRDIGSFVEEAQREIDEKVELPSGYFLTWGGQFRLQQEANKRLFIVIPITLLLICFLLYLNFGSIRNTLLIFLNIPLALVGGVAALWLTGQNLSVPASVGFIALFGIALGNGMVLISSLNQLIEKGVDMDEASITGACLRLRPVLITAATTILGLIPLLISSGTGSEVQRPLATVVVGGLFSSTVLTLLVIPALFKWFSTPQYTNGEEK
ncbi:MAG: cobalt-zinc-cadmium resistance protein CzcA [Chlamydiales bacterium]|jgi:cobalt-zinc-cadmium resistance protein CzcA